jgi:arginase
VVRRMTVIGAPSSMGAYAPGQELAPRAMRDAGLITQLSRRGVELRDVGDLPLRRWTPDPVSPRARHAGEVLAHIAGVQQAARDALDDGDRVLVLGGDCTTGLGTIAAVGSGNGRGVVYLDLHADMNVPASTTDGALDWMGLGHALDLPGAIPELAAACPLTAREVVLCGFAADSATAFENEHVAGLALPVVTRDEVAADGGAAAARALDQLDGADRIAVHFDVDLIDFNDVPLSENTAANQGVTFDAALAALGRLIEDERVVALTITEVNPLHGASDGSTVARLVASLSEVIAT